MSPKLYGRSQWLVEFEGVLVDGDVSVPYAMGGMRRAALGVQPRH